MSFRFPLVAAALLAGVSSTAHAQDNLLFNGDFQAYGGSLAGWDAGPGTSPVGSPWLAGGHQGSNAWAGFFSFLWPDQMGVEGTVWRPMAPMTLSQHVQIQPGRSYTLRWDMEFHYDRFGNTSAFRTFLDDVLVWEQVGRSSAPRSYSHTYLGTRPSSTVRFEFVAVSTCVGSLCDDAYNRALLDNVSIAVVTPEPGTWALLGTGLLAVGGIAARRRR